MVTGPASGDFAEYRLEARDIRQAARKSTTAANASTAARSPNRHRPHCRALAAARN
jgi:hypothetical protein